jgi:replicative DNA helicase
MDVVTEFAVLYCMINNPSAQFEGLSELNRQDFDTNTAQRAFKAIVELTAEGSKIDDTIVKAHINDKDFTKKYDRFINEIDIDITKYSDYITVFRKHARTKSTRNVLEDSLNQLNRKDANAYEIIKNTEQKLTSLIINKETSFNTLKNDYDDLIESIKNPVNSSQAIIVGVKSLDDVFNISNGNFIVIAGRPGMGKSALINQIIIQNSLYKNMKGLFFSIEMSRKQQWKRIISSVTEIAGWKVRTGLNWNQSDWDKLSKYENLLNSNENMLINDSAYIDISTFCALSRQEKIKYPDLDYILFDYIQLAIQSDDPLKEVTAWSKGLKLLARDLDIPIIGVSQLSRRCELRENKRPMLSDLRESGAIEQDADGVLFIYRDYYYSKKEEDKNLCEIIIGKQREGPTDTAHCFFNNSTLKFTTSYKE